MNSGSNSLSILKRGNLKALASQFGHWILDNSVKISTLVNR